jgi:hypothetical protein
MLKRICKELVVCLLFVPMMALIGCETTATKAERSAANWQEPEVPAVSGAHGKAARTARYWNDMATIVDSMYGIPLGNGHQSEGLFDAGSVVCGRAAEDMNKLSTAGVDEDAVKTVQSLYALLNELKEDFTDLGSLSAGVKEDPQALDPSHSIGAGLAAAAHDRNHQMAVQAEIARTRALLESRYPDVTFRMPHYLN